MVRALARLDMVRVRWCPQCATPFASRIAKCPSDGKSLGSADPLIGRHLSSWEVTRYLSAGSMGCVYEGVVRRPELEGTLHEVVYHPMGNGCCVHYYFSTTNLLPRLVCSGRIDLATAQREMAANWIDAYKKYLASDRPIHLHARLLLSNEPTGDW